MLLINFSFDFVIVCVQILSVLFLAILFLQSGFDKIFDKKGNLDWLITHFSNSPLKNIVYQMFYIVTTVEIISGVLNTIGIFFLIRDGNTFYATLGVFFACVTIIMLFFGQRIAKDYAGAQSLVSYFILSLMTLLLLSIN